MRILYNMRKSRESLLQQLEKWERTSDRGSTQSYQYTHRICGVVLSFMADLAELWEITPQEVIDNAHSVYRSKNMNLAHDSVQDQVYQSYITACLAQELGLKYERLQEDIQKVRAQVSRYLGQCNVRIGPDFLTVRMFYVHRARLAAQEI